MLVVEDVWTTGGSTCETIRVLEEAGARVVAAGALIDRSGGKIELPVRTEALMDLKIESYDASECPLCRSGSVAVKTRKPLRAFRRMRASFEDSVSRVSALMANPEDLRVSMLTGVCVAFLFPRNHPICPAPHSLVILLLLFKSQIPNLKSSASIFPFHNVRIDGPQNRALMR